MPQIIREWNRGHEGIAKTFGYADQGSRLAITYQFRGRAQYGGRFVREIVANAAWVHYRIAPSAVDVEGLLAERSVIISRESVRQ